MTKASSFNLAEIAASIAAAIIVFEGMALTLAGLV